MDIKEFLNEFFNKPILWMWMLIIVIAMTLHFGLLDNYSVRSWGMVPDITEKVSRNYLDEDISSPFIEMVLNATMHDLPALLPGYHMLAFNGWGARYVVDGAGIANVNISVDSALGKVWLLIGFLFIGIITRKSINSLYSVGPFLTYSIVAVICLSCFASSIEELSSTSGGGMWTVSDPAKDKIVERIVYVWWPNLATAFWSSLILGLIAFGMLRAVIKLKWLYGVDEESDKLLMFRINTNWSDIEQTIASTWKTFKQAILDNPRIGKVAKQIWAIVEKAGASLRGSSHNNSTTQELGDEAVFCPYCGKSEFDDKGRCIACNEQVCRLYKPDDSHKCSKCAHNVLSGSEIMYCYVCGAPVKNSNV